MRQRFLCYLAMAAAVPITTPAFACSVVSGYEVPTTLELVEMSNAIVLARVDGEVAGKQGWQSEIVLKPEVQIFGTSMPKELSGFGYLERGRARVTPSDPTNIRDANPDAFSGGCNRYVFRQDMLLLLFLKKQGNDYDIISAPFARTLEDVPDANALWVRAVKLYVSVAGKAKGEQEALLMQERNKLLKTGSADDKKLAEDIKRQLK